MDGGSHGTGERGAPLELDYAIRQIGRQSERRPGGLVHPPSERRSAGIAQDLTFAAASGARRREQEIEQDSHEPQGDGVRLPEASPALTATYHPPDASHRRSAPLRSLARWRPPQRAINVACALIGIAGVAWILLSAFSFVKSPGWGYDFEAYLLAAYRLAHGESPYLAWTLAAPFRPGPYGLYLYAPPLAVALLPLTALSVPASTAVWFVVRGLLLIGSCLLMPLRWQTRAVVLGVAAISEAVLVDMNLGNVSLLVLFASVVAWRFLDRPAGAASIAFAMTVRPTFAIYFVWWVLRRRWREIVVCLVTGLAIILLTLPFVGISGYRDFLTLLRNLSDVTGVPNNQDFGSAVARLGLPSLASTAALFLGYLIAVVAIVVSLRRGAEISYLVTLGATLLLSPLLWDHYLVLVLPAMGFLLERRTVAGATLALLTLFWMPAWLAPFVALGATLGPFLARPAAPANQQPSDDPYAAGSSNLSLSPT
jgi:hypothetical protein